MKATRKRTKMGGILLEQFDPFRSPSWRWDRAGMIARGECAADDRLDPIMREAVALRSRLAGQDRPSLRRRTTKASAALEKALQLHQENGLQRWMLEAYLVTGLSDEQVANRCKLTASIVSWYEAVFFRVRDRLDAQDYIGGRIIGPGRWRGFREDELNRLWMTFGYFGGPILLDAFIDTFRASWRPGQPMTTAVYFQEGSKASLEMQAVIAAHSIPVNEHTDRAFVELRLAEVEAGQSSVGGYAQGDWQKHLIVQLWRQGTIALEKRQPLKVAPKPPAEKADERTRARTTPVA